MTVYCTTCGGLPHGDREELAGPPGHLTTYGRLDAPQRLHRQSEATPTPEDGPEWRCEEMPDDAPRNAVKLVERTGGRPVESVGWWKGTRYHVLGIAGVAHNGVSFRASWRKNSKGKWGSWEFYLAPPLRRVRWADIKEMVIDGLG